MKYPDVGQIGSYLRSKTKGRMPDHLGTGGLPRPDSNTQLDTG